MPKARYDVFEFDEPAFELVSDAEMQSGCADPTVDNIGETTSGRRSRTP